MKLLILGGSNIQKHLIEEAKKKGIITIVSDYYQDVIGKQISDYSELVSTFDIQKNILVGKKYNIDGILTIGTDQPVYTVAKVSEALNLSKFISVETALAVTNKKVMKKIFIDNNIPCNKYVLIKKDFKDIEMQDLNFPVVIKPVDSQGQRGIYKLYSLTEIREKIKETLSYSRTDEVLVEEYYESKEIAVSGWVNQNETKILLVTDRKTFSKDNHIGICYAHNFPSVFLKDYENEITTITNKLVDVFKIENGPIYFQMLIGNKGIKVNEIACRIGGAYEDYTIPLLTNINILDTLINASLNMPIDYQDLNVYNLKNNHKVASVQLFFCKEGIVKELSLREDILKLPGIVSMDYNIKVNDKLDKITSAINRAGYVIVVGDNLKNLEKNLINLFDNLKVLDNFGNNLVINYFNY